MPGDRPMRRLRDPVRRTVRRLGWAVGAGTRRLGARTWPGAGGRMDKQRRPEQRGKRDPVTLPRPGLPVCCCCNMARCVRARRVGRPNQQPRRRRPVDSCKGRGSGVAAVTRQSTAERLQVGLVLLLFRVMPGTVVLGNRPSRTSIPWLLLALDDLLGVLAFDHRRVTAAAELRLLRLAHPCSPLARPAGARPADE